MKDLETLRTIHTDQEPIDLLVSFDENYIHPFRVLVKSLAINHVGENFQIWLLHSGIAPEKILDLENYCELQKIALIPIIVNRELFHDAPVTNRYPQEMYYRLLAPFILPESLKRVLYLDPDILVINSVRPLWELPLGEYSFAAASHSGVFEIINDVNRIRLGKEHAYFNTGVLLMNLDEIRTQLTTEKIFDCFRQQSNNLLLPDQDVFNILLGDDTLQIDDKIWNYDTRYYSAYLLKSEGQFSLDEVLHQTVILHFCGKKKPWQKKHSGLFSALYKHYMNLVEKEIHVM